MNLKKLLRATNNRIEQRKIIIQIIHSADTREAYDIPAYLGAKSRWFTAHPAIDTPDRPTAMTIKMTAFALLHSMKPAPTRHAPGPRKPATVER